jgi:ribosome biogenesis SPOUT family RNA methylase Rps3
MPRRAAFIARSPDASPDGRAGSPALNRAMDRPELLDRAIALYQPRSPRPLTPEDGREIVGNIAGFFSVLADWDRRAREKAMAEADVAEVAS